MKRSAKAWTNESKLGQIACVHYLNWDKSELPFLSLFLHHLQPHLSLDSGMGLEPPTTSDNSRTCPTTPLNTHISRMGKPPLSRTQSGTTVNFAIKHPKLTQRYIFNSAKNISSMPRKTKSQ